MTTANPASTPHASVRFVLRLLILILMGLNLSACIVTQEDRFWTHAPGWSRAQFIGETGSMRPVSIDVDEEGTLYAVYFEREPDTVLTALAMSADGQERWRFTFDTEDVLEGRNPSLLHLEDGVHLFWIVSGDLVELHLSDEGTLVAMPVVISAGEKVIYYDVERGSGNVYSIWFSSSRDSLGIYRLDPVGTTYTTTLVDPEGVYPDIAFDQNDALHAVWSRNPRQLTSMTFEYRLYDGGNRQREVAARTLNPVLRSSDNVEGPVLGINGMIVHVGWITSIRTGLRAGDVEPMVTSFIPGFTETYSDPTMMRISMDYELPYEEWEGDLRVGPRSEWSFNRNGTVQIKDLATVSTSLGEMALAARTRISTRSGQDQSQITLAYLKDGMFDSYQLLTFTYSSSVTPSLAVGPDGSIYAVWLELTDEDEFSIYLSSTGEAMRETFNALTGDDYRQMATDTLFGMVSGALLTPVVFLWLMPGMLVLLMTAWLRNRPNASQKRMDGLSVGLAVAAYWYVKTAMFPSILTTVPFKLWIPIIPAGVGMALRILIPLLVTLLAVGGGYRQVRKRGSFSPASFLLVYGLLDGVCTVAIYGADFIRL